LAVLFEQLQIFDVSRPAALVAKAGLERQHSIQQARFRIVVGAVARERALHILLLRQLGRRAAAAEDVAKAAEV